MNEVELVSAVRGGDGRALKASGSGNTPVEKTPTSRKSSRVLNSQNAGNGLDSGR